MNGSNSAVIEHARSGKRYEIRDKALQSIARHASATSSEIAVNVLLAEGIEARLSEMNMIEAVRLAIRVASIQKRVSDLLKLGYIYELSHRVCQVTSYTASTYTVTDKGMEYLNNKGIATTRTQPAMPSVSPVINKSLGLAALKASRMHLS